MNTRRGFKSRYPILIAGFVLLLAISPAVLAEVSVQNVTGTITITMPGGEVVTVEPGQPIPAITSGATVEAITGTAEISATGGDTVNVLINESTATLTDGAQIGVTVSPTGDATLNVISGTVTVLNADGTTQTLSAGESLVALALKPVSAQGPDIPGTGPNYIGPEAATGYKG